MVLFKISKDYEFKKEKIIDNKKLKGLISTDMIADVVQFIKLPHLKFLD